MFDTDSIKHAIESDLNTDVTVPDGHKVALVTFINSDKAEIALATKLSDHWSVQLIANHSWTGDNQVGVISKITW